MNPEANKTFSQKAELVIGNRFYGLGLLIKTETGLLSPFVEKCLDFGDVSGLLESVKDFYLLDLYSPYIKASMKHSKKLHILLMLDNLRNDRKSLKRLKGEEQILLIFPL